MKNKAIPIAVRVIVMASVLIVHAIAQNSGGSGTAVPGVTPFGNNYQAAVRGR